MPARARIAWLADPGSFVEEAAEVRSADPLAFFDLRPYRERLAEAELNTGLTDAMVVGAATLDDQPLELAVMDFAFMGGSMGGAVGEKFVRACDAAIAATSPLLLVTSSGGARMQEGILSLMQLPKTIAAIDELHEERAAALLPAHEPDDGRRDGELRDARRRDRSPSRVRCSPSPAPGSFRRSSRRSSPTTSGAPSSICATARSTPSSPDPSSASTSRGSSGSLAGEAERRLRERLGRLKSLPLLHRTGVSGEERRLREQLDSISARRRERGRDLGLRRACPPSGPALHARLRRADPRRLGRAPRRPRPGRRRRDRRRVSAGSTGRTIALIGHQKGRDLKERLARQYGMPHPEGYAKAIRVMELADRFGFPIVSLIDTPGAYPGVAAEQHGQGGAIARSQAAMLSLAVPTVACVIGEGGSGGALALAVSDRVLMQENAIYSVITPEGCAMILWRDPEEKKKAAAAFKPDAFHCFELGVIDGIVAEPRGGAHEDPEGAAATLKQALLLALEELDETPSGRAATGAPREVPRHGRLRLDSGVCAPQQHFLHTIHRVFNHVLRLCERAE